MRGVIRFCLELASRRGPNLVLCGHHDRAQLRQCGGPFDGSQCEPGFDSIGISLTGRCHPSAVRSGHRAQQLAIKPLIAAQPGDVIFRRPFRQTHELAELPLERRRIAELLKLLVTSRALAQIIDRRALAEPQAQALDVGDQRFIAAGFRVGQQLGERAVSELFRRPAFEGLQSRRDPRFGRKGGEQRLREAVNCLDPEATRRVEHAREQPPRVFQKLRSHAFTEVDEVGLEFARLHPHPRREAVADAIGHFRRARLGERQAQDRLRRRTLEEQAINPRGQDVRLAATRRRRKGGARERIGGERLLVSQLGKGFG